MSDSTDGEVKGGGEQIRLEVQDDDDVVDAHATAGGGVALVVKGERS
jgi:hypothetical protein